MVNCNSLTKRKKIASYFSTCNINTPPNDTVKPPSLELYCEVKPQRTHIKLAYRCKRQNVNGKYFLAGLWFILFTHLISHCTCFAVSSCVCTSDKRRCVLQRCLCVLLYRTRACISGCGDERWRNTETWREKEIMQRLLLSPLSRPPPFSFIQLEQHAVNSGGAWWITCSTVCVSFSGYSAVIDFSRVS